MIKFYFALLFATVCFFAANAQCPSGTSATTGNVVVNGDFSAGNTGFSSAYTYCGTNQCQNAAQIYSVGSNAATYNSAFQGSDHTTGTGNFFIANGATANSNISAWCETVTVTPNTVYIFKAWASTLYSGSPARFQLMVNGIATGAVYTAPGPVNTWGSFTTSWNSGTDTSASLCLVNQNTVSNSNDFGLDDISFIPCTCNFILGALTDTAICKGNNVNINLPTGADSYLWTPSVNISCDTCASVTFSPDTNTVYTAHTTFGSCKDSASIAISISQGTTSNVSDSICVLGPAYNLPWGGSATTTGLYSHNYSTISGCDSIVNITLVYRNTAPVNITSDRNIFCSGDSVQVCAPAGYATYEWNVPPAADSCLFVKNAGNYYVTVTDVNGCHIISNHLHLNVYPVPAVSFTVKGDTLSAFGADSVQWILNGVDIPGATQLTYIARVSGNYSVRIVDDNGCHTTSSPVYILVNDVAVNDLEKNYTFNIYPNPVTDGRLIVFVSTGLISKPMHLYDISGKLIIERKLSAERTELNINSLSAGIYFLKVEGMARRLVVNPSLP